MTTYPLYDHLAQVSKTLSLRSDLAPFINDSLMNLSPDQATHHHYELMTLILHHAVLNGNDNMYEAEKVSDSADHHEQHIRVSLEKLPPELLGIINAYVKMYEMN